MAVCAGVTTQADVDAGKTKIFAPINFLDHAVAENVMAGTAMSRRASYMYGNLLPPNAKGQVWCRPGHDDFRWHRDPDSAD